MLLSHACKLGVAGSHRTAYAPAHAARVTPCDMRSVRASALRSAVAGMRTSAIVDAFLLDATNPTHRRRVERWLADGAPAAAIAMLPAEMRDRYHAALWGEERAA